MTTIEQQVPMAQRLIALAERCGAQTGGPSNWPIQFSPPSLLGFVQALVNSPELREVAQWQAAQNFLEDKTPSIAPIDTDPTAWGKDMLAWGDQGVKPEAMSTFLLAVGEATLRVNALAKAQSALAQRLETRNQAMALRDDLNRRLLGVIEGMGNAQIAIVEAGPDDNEKAMLRARLRSLEQLMAEPVLAGMQEEANAQSMGLPSVAAGMLCGMFIQMLDQTDCTVESANYLEVRAMARHHGELAVTVQRVQGKSPHALRQQAESDKALLVGLLQTHGIDVPSFPEVKPVPFPDRGAQGPAASTHA